MKRLITLISIFGSLIFTACSGNHPANADRDTAEMRLPQTKSTDTTKATQTDHSGNGGSQAVMDTAKNK